MTFIAIFTFLTTVTYLLASVMASTFIPFDYTDGAKIFIMGGTIFSIFAAGVIQESRKEKVTYT